MSLKRILVLYTGGTFGMSANLKIPNLSAKALKSRLTRQVPEMTSLADCEVEVLFNLDSCQMNLTHWLTLAERIRAAKTKFDGAIILHGTDTLAYTAAALSMLLGEAPFPVVLTGAQRPLATLRNDARTNLISALEVASHAPKALRNRVLVVFHDEVFLGSRVRKKSAIDFAAFESPRFPRLATIGSEVTYQEILKHLPALKSSSPILNRFKHESAFLFPSILSLEVSPNFPSHALTEETLKSVDAILLTLYASGTAPTDDPAFLEFLKRAKKSRTPVLALTEREQAPAKLSTYSAGKTLEKSGVLWCPELTPEAAYVKAGLLKLACPHPKRLDFYRWIKKSWARAISDES